MTELPSKSRSHHRSALAGLSSCTLTIEWQPWQAVSSCALPTFLGVPCFSLAAVEIPFSLQGSSPSPLLCEVFYCPSPGGCLNNSARCHLNYKQLEITLAHFPYHLWAYVHIATTRPLISLFHTFSLLLWKLCIICKLVLCQHLIISGQIRAELSWALPPVAPVSADPCDLEITFLWLRTRLSCSGQSQNCCWWPQWTGSFMVCQHWS